MLRCFQVIVFGALTQITVQCYKCVCQLFVDLLSTLRIELKRGFVILAASYV